ncbi:hypothetical protein IF188_11420 [Microbacterium sp. NEAU-LLC]|uniref:Uncharacterized protein n=1 Tax=Microbacterium helvum TaxID=2773713 RepID=A0ABR8NRD3_9MICO|nr:hypothetical protein [Microbacterium helvum]MBD3942307.1 hypothetical protein [Microbacterium helvum]
MKSPLKKNQSPKRRTIAGIAVALGIAAASVAPVGAANASGWWSPVHVTCPAGKFAQVKFTVSVDQAIIGYGATKEQAMYGNYITINPGTSYTLNFGLNDAWWQKWNDPGSEVVNVTTQCVSWG